MTGHKPGKSGGDQPRVAMALQGGGALGAYQVGCYRAMTEKGYEPDWFSGISIGAVNATILAGNLPEKRLQQLEKFWETVTRPSEWWDAWLYNLSPTIFMKLSGMQSQFTGQPNFFVPRIPPIPQMALPGTPSALSYADVSPLRQTLLELVDFDYLNSGRSPRLCLGATEVTTGRLVFFDNQKTKLTPDHTLASGALPPGFAPVTIDGVMYWDGGVASNTPLQTFLDNPVAGSLLVFMVDLFAADAPEPRTMDDVMWRQSQIHYASRVQRDIRNVTRRWNSRRLLVDLLRQAPRERRQEFLQIYGDVSGTGMATAGDLNEIHDLDLVHVSYQPGPGTPPEVDHEFSRISVKNRSDAGYEDMKHAILGSPWISRKKAALQGACVHHCQGGHIHTRTHLG